MSPLCVVFDIDDTLYLERDYVASGFRATGAWVSEWLGIPDFAGRCRALFTGGHRSNIFNLALTDFGIEPSPALVQTLVEIYRTHVPDIRLAPDAALVIPQIAATWPIAIVTDGPPSAQSAKASALGLRRFARPIILTGTLGPGFSKPHPRAFSDIERAVAASHFVYIADNPRKDFSGPGSLGWSTIRIRRPGGIHCSAEPTGDLPDTELAAFTSLVSVLTGIAERSAHRASA